MYDADATDGNESVNLFVYEASQPPSTHEHPQRASAYFCSVNWKERQKPKNFDRRLVLAGPYVLPCAQSPSALIPTPSPPLHHHRPPSLVLVARKYWKLDDI